MRKRLFLCLLAIAVLLPSAGFASGLGGLTGGGLSGLLEENASGEPGVVPDPAEILGAQGSVLQSDYTFTAGYVCTAYLYPQAENLEAFVSDYTAAAEQNGFTVQPVETEGYTGWQYQAPDGSYALLFPEFEGNVLLLVQNGMQFGEPARSDLYISFPRNGRSIEGTWQDGTIGCEESRRSIGTSTSFEIMYYFSRAPITYFTMAFPNYAQAGDVFHVTRDRLIDGVTMYTAEDGYLVFHDISEEHRMESDSDYLRIEIESMTETDAGMVIEGTFSASFDRGQMTYTDGEFRVLSDW